MKRLKKIAVMLLMALSINTISAPFVFAASSKPTTRLTTDTSAQNRSIPTAAVKKAIRWAITHMPTIIKDVESVCGKSAASKLKKYSSKVTGALNKLLAYEDLTYSAIQDAVYRALYDYVGGEWATIIALGVREAIYYLAPI